jgi:hypothetical protein
MITYRYASAFVRDDFDRNESAGKADAISKLYLSVTGENDATLKSHRQRYLHLASKMKLSIDEGHSVARASYSLQKLANKNP